MYHFAIVALLALAAYKTVDFVWTLFGADLPGSVKKFTTLGMGVLFTELLDYSVFGHWGIGVREAWMGPLFTGLMVGAMTYLWHEALGLLEGYGRRSRDEAIEIESRTPRAA